MNTLRRNLLSMAGLTPLLHACGGGSDATLSSEAGAMLRTSPSAGAAEWPDQYASNISNRTFYVAPNGNDRNAGTLVAPFKTLGRALWYVDPGDTIILADGIYSGVAALFRSGAAGRYITIRAANKWGAKLVGPAGSYSALQLRGVGWVRIEGLDIQASMGHAIDAEGCHHIQIIGNRCHDSGGGGISVNTSDYVSIEANEVFHNTRTNRFQCSGISLYQARAYDSQPGFHIYVRRNLVYSNVETSTGLAETSEGNGIILDDFQNLQSSPGNVAAGSYSAETLIENNIIGFNGGAGIVIFQSNYAVVRHNSVALNNTDKKNLQTFRGELASTKSHHVRWYNNFSACDRTSNPHSHAMMDVVNGGFINQGNEWKGNLFFDPSTPSSTPILVWGPGNTLSTAVIEANNLLRRNPLLVRNFDLSNVNYFAGTVNSPMTNGALPSYASATDYFGRARVNTPDIGAIEAF